MAFVMLALLCFSLAIFTPSNTAHAAVGINHQINFQGKLVNTDGTNVTNGSYSIVFSIYTVASAGANIWTETQTPTVTNGIFQVNLGAVTTLPGSIDFNTDNVYLGIKVGADLEMTPRVQFTSVPQAFNAEKLGGLDKTGFIQNSVSQQVTSNFNISGAGVVGTSLTTPLLQAAAATALTITGNAASTFSTSAGTLTIQSGSGTLSLGSTTALNSNAGLTITGGTTLALTSTGVNAISLDSGTTGGINIGTNANAKTITLGNVTGATSVVVDCGTVGCSFGASATAHPTTIGSLNTTSTTTLQSGTGGVNIGTGGIANTVQIGTTTGAVVQTINIGNNATAASTSNVVIGSTIAGSTTLQNSTTINLNAGTVVGNATTQNLFNTTATTVNFAGAATTLSVGAAGGTTTINGNLTVAAAKTLTVGNLSTAGIVTNTAAGAIGTVTTIPVANGGTNLASYTANSVLYASAATTISQATASSAQVLLGNGSGVPTFTALTGDVTIGNTGITAIGANKVVDAFLRQGGATSIIGRSANSTGNVADISAAADGQVLRRIGGVLGFGTLDNTSLTSGSFTNITGVGTLTSLAVSGLITASSNTTGIALTGTPAAVATSSLIQVGSAIAGGNAVVNGGTYFGLNAPAAGAGSTADFLNFQLNGVNKLLVTNTGAVSATSFAGTGSGLTSLNGSSISSGTVAVAQGGTGVGTTPTNGQLLFGNGTNYTVGTLGVTGLTATPGVGTLALAVNYGSGANQAAQGNTNIVCPSAAGNASLSGTGNTIAVGAGGTCTALTLSSTPSFTTLTVSGGGPSIIASGAPSASATASLYQGGSAIIGGSANGTLYGGNIATTADLLNLQVSGAFKIKVDNAGNQTLAGSLTSVGVNAGTGLIQGSGGLNISSGTVTLPAASIANAALQTSVTTQGNTFNGVSQLVQLNASSQYPALSGTLITNLNASALASGTVGATFGGTGQSSYAVGDLLYAGTTTTISKLADVAAGQCLVSGGVGVAPAYGACGTSNIVAVPTSSAQNTITPATSGVVGLTVNGTNVATAATALIVNQGFSADGQALNVTGGSQTNGLVVTRTNAGTTTNLLNLTNTSGTVTNGILLSGTYTNLINAGAALTVTNAGAVTAGNYNLQTISNAANFTGTLAVATSVATPLVSINGGGNPGGQGIRLNYATSTPNSGPSIQWTSGALTSDVGLYVNSGLNFQGDTSNPDFRVRTPTTDGTLGTEVVHLGGASTSAFSWFNGGNVGIGDNAPTAAKASIINTVATQSALQVKGAASPSAGTYVLDVQDSTGTNHLLSVSSTGGLTVNSTTAFNTGTQANLIIANVSNNGGAVLQGGNSFTTNVSSPVATNSASVFGNTLNLTTDASKAISYTGDLIAGFGQTIFTGTTSTASANTYGLLGKVQNNGSPTGLVTNAIGVAGAFGFDNATPVTNAYALRAMGAQSGTSAAVVNAYGLYIDNVSYGTTKNYSIYSAGGANYLAGNLGVGIAVPTAVLHVVGTQPASVAGTGTTATQAVTIVGAAGGNTSGITGQTAGTGGSISISAGNGGTAVAGGNSGWGGNIVLQSGFQGVGGAGIGAGLDGAITLNPTLGVVSINGAGILGYSTAIHGASIYDGTQLHKNTSTASFQVQNASAVPLLNADTSNMRINIGSIGTPTSQLFVGGSLPTATLGSLGISAGPRDIVVSGRYAYVAFATTPYGIGIYDLSSPASPVLVGSVNVGNASSGVAVSGNYVYVTNFLGSSVSIFDVTNPASPVSVGTATVSSGPTDVAVAGRYMYVTNFSANSLSIVDVTNPAAPISVSTTTTNTGPNGVTIQGKFAYVLDKTANNVQIFDISNPAVPVLTTAASSYAGANSAVSMRVVGRYAYIVNTGVNTLNIADISNPTVVTSVGSVAIGANSHAIVISGRYAYISSVGSNLITVIDISNPASPTSVGTIPSSGGTYGLAVSGRYAFATTSTGNTLQSFDLGGSYIQQLETGSIEAAAISVTGGVNIQGALTTQSSGAIGTSLTVGRDLSVAGSVRLGGAANSQVIITGNSGSDAATVSAEKLTSQDFTNATYWTGCNGGAGGWTGTITTSAHNTGNTIACSATATNYTVVSGATYQVQFQLAGNTTSTDTVTVSLGGFSAPAIGQSNTNTQTAVITTTGTGALTFTPTTNFNGTISAVSVKLITLANSTLTVQSSTGAAALEVRVSSANSNTFLGLSSGQANTTGAFNTATGAFSLQNNTTGLSNTASGAYSLQLNTTGNFNTAPGYYSLTSNTTGSNNTALGATSLQSNTTGSNNTANGVSALLSNTTGSNNTAIGASAGYQDAVNTAFTTGAALQNATAIGAYAQVQANNSIVLGSVDNATKVGIGTTIPLNTFSVSPVDQNSTTNTATQSTNTITATVGTPFLATMVGEQFIFANGTSAGTITGFTSSTVITVSVSQTVTPAQKFRTHFIGLQVTSAGNVGIGTAATTANLLVKDLNNTTLLQSTTAGLTVNGTSAFNLGGSANSITANVSDNGAAVLQGGNILTTNVSSPVATNSASVFGNTLNLTTDGSKAISYTGDLLAGIGQLIVTGATNTASGNSIGLLGKVQNNGSASGLISNAIGVAGAFQFDNATPVTNAYALRALGATAGSSAAVQNAYGLYVDNVNYGTSSNYSIYSAGGANYLAGNLGIGASVPGSQLQITGPTFASQTGNGLTTTNALTVTASNGGSTTGTTGQAAAAGASIVLTAGNGGSAPLGSSRGWGGNVVLQAGFTGTGLGTSGLDGAVLINNTTMGQVGINGNANFGFNNSIHGATLFDSPQPANTTGNGILMGATVTVTGAKGQNTTGTTGQLASTGSVVTITAGAGGDAPALSTNGNGGGITFQGGAPGAGAGTAGTYGNILFQQNGGNVGIGTGAANFNLDVQGTSGLRVKTTTNTTSAFQIQNATSASLINADTTNMQITIGSATTDTTQVNLQLDSSSTYADTGTCATTTNQGALYYNTTSDSLRLCEGGNGWTDAATIKGLGLLSFGVMPDSGTGAGDILGITGSGSTNGPCKVSFLTTTTVKIVQGCIAYSGGRKVVIPDNTTPTGSLTFTAGNFIHVCLTGTSNQPAFSASGTEFANLPAFSTTAPILCLADIKTSATVLTNIYDVRTFTTSLKTFGTSNFALGLGYGVAGTTTNGQVQASTGVAQVNQMGIAVATTGATSTTTVNVIYAVAGPANAKAAASNIGTSGYVQASATAGYMTTTTVAAGAYANLGVNLRQSDTSCSTATGVGGSTACQYSMPFIIAPR